MKTPSFLRVFAPFAVLAAAAPVGAQDYQCRNASGCVATIYQDGASRKVLFRKGDLVSTASGWAVDPKDGWVKVPSGKRGNSLAPSEDGS